MEPGKLSLGDFGDNVARLHETLKSKGFEASSEEVKRKFFGPSTRQVVGEFQKAHGIDPTCEVCEKTANLLFSSPPEVPITSTSINSIPASRTELRVNQSPSETSPKVPILNLDAIGKATAEVIGRQTGQPVEQFIVRGTIRLADGSPLGNVTVQAFDKDLRRLELLGQSITDRAGNYQIPYTRVRFIRAEKQTADLVIAALEPIPATVPQFRTLATSPTLFNAPADAVVDLVISADVITTSVYERLMVELRPLLGKVAIANLREDEQDNPNEEKYKDISFLSGETGSDKNVIARLVMAHKLAEQAIQPEFWFALLGGSFYQYTETQNLDKQFAAILNSLSSLDARAVDKALTRSFNQKEIPANLQKNVASWIKAFLQFIAQRTVSESDQPSFVKSVLVDAGIQNPKKQEKFAHLYNQYKTITPELLKELEKDKSFTQSKIDNLRTSFQLADLTQGDFSVVKAIKQEFDVGQPEQIRFLAKRSKSEWVNLVTTKYAAREINLPFETRAIAEQLSLPEAEVYGKTLERQFRQAFPTTAFTGGLERALQNGGAHGLQHAEALNRFLNRHETFEFLNTPVDDFFQDNIHSEFRELAVDENFRLEVKAVQRVFKLAPTFEATDALLADDLHSAQKVYRLGESEFVRQYGDRPGFTPETARLAWNRAADTHAAVLTIVADLKALEAETLPLALQNNSTALANFPNWNNLFKTGDLCECEHCRSVLSPAAYFADLLMFLKDRNSKRSKLGGGFYSVKDILFDRRPDLGFLELNCDNALVPLPYIDVVCEVLEAAIDSTGENDLELAGFTAIPADPVAAKTAIAASLQSAFNNSPTNDGKEKIELDSDFSLSQVNPSDPDQWVVHGDKVTYLLKKKPPSTNFFAEVLRNTKAKADELRAYPQYVNPKAYDKLRQAKYPMTLPFDLFAEEVRAGFQKTNLQRWDLMRTLQGNAAPNNPTDGDIAAEYFGISISTNPTDPSEKNLILNADPTISGQQTIWGVTGTNWLDTVGNVKNLLQKTNLEYNELLALLDLKFINPTGDLVIQHLDASCDTDKKVIQGLDAPKLDRIHRFLRLWRKLNGWKLWELDLVICHPGIGNQSATGEWLLNEPFLLNLFYFSQLKNKLGGKTTVEQICALFGNLNTETHFTKLHEKRQDALYQNLFLNKRLIQPLDPAFEVTKVNVAAPTTEKISSHHPVLLAALGIREADLVLFKELTKASDGTPYINDELTLTNLSFLWRHAWLSKLLKFKAEDWKIALKIFPHEVPNFVDLVAKQSFLETKYHIQTADLTLVQIDELLQKIFYRNVLDFACPKSAFEFLEKVDRLKASGFTPDELNWLLAGDRDTKSAIKEADAIRFLTTLRKDLQNIKAEFAIALPTDEAGLIALLTSLLQRLNRSETETEAFITIVRNGVTVSSTPAEFIVKFYEPKFSVSLTKLPATIDFQTQLSNELAIKIAYNLEQRLLHFTGIMSNAEQSTLLALSNDADYVAAITSLATQPQTIALPDERIWLTDTDLDSTQAANDTYAKRLTNAIVKALGYFSKTLTENAIVQQSSAQLVLTEALTRHLLADYPILPSRLLTHLSGNFALDTTTLDGWYWVNRVATLLKKWKITLAELEKMTALTTGAQLLDFLTLPLDSTGAIASFDRFLRTGRLMRLRDSLPETEVTLLEVLEKLNQEILNPGTYTSNTFADDLERLNEAWLTADVNALTASLDLAYPEDYLLAENWERLRRAFYFIDNLNVSADRVKRFAAAPMGFEDARKLKELLRSKFGAETWLTLSAEIQDVLRERKRDALSAYLLAQSQPADAPSGKWENTNDLYAYYLLDVEMSSCQLTSRLVQASGSVQLFVQRCFMGLEPDVIVKADGGDGDSAWRWWKWMRKYRVWEANRKVFLWPENWIEPELKKDRSSFFKDLENELLQNEINQDTVEKAFINYLEKLDGVAQLEIAGFYQEDDGDNTIVHVFGRTQGAEPHLYYYRRYDYRQWTPWEKVDLDIQGDYLIPVVVNKRLFLFWPVFTEIPDDTQNEVTIPDAQDRDPITKKIKPHKLDKTKKKLRLQMAVSDYRQGKWTPKRVSKDFDTSSWYDVEIVRKHYRFFPIDRSEIDGRFGIKYEGYSFGSNGSHKEAWLYGAFEISGCQGVPERTNFPGYFKPAIRPKEDSTGNETTFLKWVELLPYDRTDKPENDFTLENIFFTQSDNLRFPQVLVQTPWIFKMTPSWHLSYLDKLWLDGLVGFGRDDNDAFSVPTGSWLPFFYSDKKRTFFVLPSLGFGANKDRLANVSGSIRYYYPEIKKAFRQLEDYFEGLVQTWLDNFDLSALTSVQRQQLEQLLERAFPEEPLPPYTDEHDEQFKNLLKRWFMRFFHYYLGALSLLLFQFRQFHFKNYYHPFVCDFAKLVYNPLKGIPALMSRETQLKNTGFSFKQHYQPTEEWVVEPPTEAFYPQEIVDFTPDGAYSPYNWELFFHAPLLVANSLSKNQRFEEARDWYHFIFNPIGVESSVPLLPGDSLMRKYWITKPFFETTKQDYLDQRIDNILRMLAGDTSAGGTTTRDELEKQVNDWRTNPFEPHRIANYRTVAYQKTVVMKYLDNLIAWGDNLFRQDSMESINEATQLYILAAEILGPRPKKIPPQAKPPLESFNELETQFDQFSNALVQVENLVPVIPGDGQNGGDSAPLPMLYFCIPQNDKMLGYWDTVADRLYKIRHCMNIEGVVRQLALFEPPIDPGALVKAIAGGVDISSALADLNAPLPLYRFNVLLQKANEVCNDVKALGSALLVALEKKDAEAMSLLRQGQEIRLLEAVKAVREQQIDEAKETAEGIRRSRSTVEERRNYYRDIDKVSGWETASMVTHGLGIVSEIVATVLNATAGTAHLVPSFKVGASGFGGTPHVTVEYGGDNVGKSAFNWAAFFSGLGGTLHSGANLIATQASNERRWDDWKLQERLADKELLQMDKQIAAAELRIAIAEKELENHVLQIENAKATDEFMRSKYTNQELYQWQIGQISGVYFQSYKLAYDLAKRAERCFRFEVGLQDSSYIQFGYWDSLKKGLLSGEKLQYDLRRLEAAYLEQNRREFELTKHVSLTLLDPLALVKLRETGRCFINLPEEIFDLDYPGHYFRRIKSVSITLPCVVGPYTTISCTLRLLKNSIRINTANGVNGYPRNTDDQSLPADDDRFIENNIPVKAIAASNAQNDSGVFELNFRDERYLPFEGAGAISQWSLELFNDNSADFGKALRQFDYSTITDAILHIKYTAREDAGSFKNGAIAHLREYFSQDDATPSFRMFNLRQEFPSQWHRFLNPANPANGNVFELEMSPDLFPIRDQGKTLKVNAISLLARCTDKENYSVVLTPPLPVPPASNKITLVRNNKYGGLHFSQPDITTGIDLVPTNPPVKWQLKMTRSGGNLKEEVEDLLLVLGYEWEWD